MVEETESPRIYHLWCALTGVSVCLGRRVWLPFGHEKLYANQYAFLIGHPGTRKSTAMRIMKRAIQKSTSVRFAPEDTSGQRQGLVKHMAGMDTEEIERQLNQADGLSTEALQVEDLENLQLDTRIDYRDKEVACVASSEVSRFLGQKQIGMLDFLVTTYDGEYYDYRTGGVGNTQHIILNEPLLSILGCTTPASLVECLPKQAAGQGFLSRVILIYGSKKYKKIARPIPPDEKLMAQVEAEYSRMHYEYEGEMQETKEAVDFSVKLYDDPIQISDSRFLYYNERRYSHLLKLGMVLAVARDSKMIDVEDYIQAQEILAVTEETMPDALGEFGMSKTAAAKQYMLEFLRSMKEPATMGILRAATHRDLNHGELSKCIDDLMASGQIMRAETSDRGQVYFAKEIRKENTKVLMNAMEE